MEQAIGIPMGIDPALFWVNLFLYSYEEEYMSPLLIYSFKISENISIQQNSLLMILAL